MPSSLLPSQLQDSASVSLHPAVPSPVLAALASLPPVPCGNFACFEPKFPLRVAVLGQFGGIDEICVGASAAPLQGFAARAIPHDLMENYHFPVISCLCFPVPEVETTGSVLTSAVPILQRVVSARSLQEQGGEQFWW